MARVMRFERNTSGRDLIVGDVHGCFGKLQAALDAVKFDPEAGDRLFSVGDLIDRGPQSEDVLDWLAKPWFHAVMGNHEQMALLYDGGETDAFSYSINGGAWLVGKTDAERGDYVCEFMNLPVAIELDTPRGIVGIVHANCSAPTWQKFKQRIEGDSLEAIGAINLAMWDRTRVDDHDLSEIPDVRAVVVGHTPLQFAQWLGNVLHIDTGGWLQGGKVNRPITLINAHTLMAEVARHG